MGEYKTNFVGNEFFFFFWLDVGNELMIDWVVSIGWRELGLDLCKVGSKRPLLSWETKSKKRKEKKLLCVRNFFFTIFYELY